jgi:ABC-type sugar transport system ATPase subunit
VAHHSPEPRLRRIGIFSQYHSDCGEVILNGQVCRFESPHESILAGIAMIHQELNPVLDLTVAENIFLGREIGKSGLYNHKVSLPSQIVTQLLS